MGTLKCIAEGSLKRDIVTGEVGGMSSGMAFCVSTAASTPAELFLERRKRGILEDSERK
jgi:hypothetical protein